MKTFIIIICLWLITITSKAQLIQTPADIIRSFPATQLLLAIDNLQTDLRNCEQTNTNILKQQAIANDKLSKLLSLTQNSLLYQTTRADSLSKSLVTIQSLTKEANKDIKKAKFWLFLDKFKLPIAIIGTAFLTSKLQ